MSDWFLVFRQGDTINYKISFLLHLFGVSVFAMPFTIQGKVSAAAAKLRKPCSWPRS